MANSTFISPVEAIGPTLSSAEHDAENAALGFRFIRAIAVEKAALDRNLPRACTFILAAISYFMNSQTKRAWPSYRKIAELTDYSEDVIERSIRELKRAGYIFSERRAPITGGRALVHYGLGAVHPRDIDRMITAAVGELRRSSTRTPDPVKNSGVRHGVTPSKTTDSEADPGNFSASDSVKFPPQEPIRKEPTKRKSEERRNAAFYIEERHLEEFAKLYNIWGNERGIVLAPVNRELTDRLLSDELGIHQSTEPAVLQEAFLAALNTISSKSSENSLSSSRPASVGGSAMLSYFRKCLRSEIGNVRLSAATLTAKARAEQLAQEALITQRVQSIREPRSNHRGKPSMADIAAQAFGSERE